MQGASGVWFKVVDLVIVELFVNSRSRSGEREGWRASLVPWVLMTCLLPLDQLRM